MRYTPHCKPTIVSSFLLCIIIQITFLLSPVAGREAQSLENIIEEHWVDVDGKLTLKKKSISGLRNFIGKNKIIKNDSCIFHSVGKFDEIQYLELNCGNVEIDGFITAVHYNLSGKNIVTFRILYLFSIGEKNFLSIAILKMDPIEYPTYMEKGFNESGEVFIKKYYNSSSEGLNVSFKKDCPLEFLEKSKSFFMDDVDYYSFNAKCKNEKEPVKLTLAREKSKLSGPEKKIFSTLKTGMKVSVILQNILYENHVLRWETSKMEILSEQPKEKK